MWLLNTSTAEQTFFIGPEAVPGGYAILSHVWDKKEDSFQSVREAVGEAKGEMTQKKEIETLKMEVAALKAQVAALVKVVLEAKAKTDDKEDEAAKADVVQGRASDIAITKPQSLVQFPLLGEH